MIEFVGSFGGWEVSLKRPVLESVVRLEGCVSYKSRAGNCLVVRRLGSLSYTPLRVIFLVVVWVGSFSYTPHAGICLVVRQ